MKKFNINLMIIIVLITTSFLYYYQILSSYFNYQIIRYTNPQAILNVLMPAYSYIIFVLLLLCIIILYYRLEHEYIRIILLVNISIILWITPYFFSGFSRIGDSLYHTGLSLDVSEILRLGRYIGYNIYVIQYPISFIFNYIFINITGMDIIFYQLIFYPILSAIMFILLWYIFISRLFNHDVSFLSIVFSLVFLIDPPQIHPSPHSYATILTILSFSLLITNKNVKEKIIGFLIGFICIITHPISPIIIIILLITTYFINKYIFINKIQIITPISIYEILFFIIMWLSWILLYARAVGREMIEAVSNLLTSTFFYNLDIVIEQGTSITRFLYPEISLLTKIVRYSFIILTIAIVFYRIKSLNLKKGIKTLFTQIETILGPKVAYVIVIGFIFLSLAVVIEISGIFIGMMERSYFYFIFITSSYIGFELKNIISNNPFSSARKYVLLIIIISFSSLSIIYPLIVYTYDSAEQYPPSEGFGLKFVTSHIDLSNNSIAMATPLQLYSFMNFQTNWNPAAYFIQNSTFSSSNLYPWHETFAGSNDIPELWRSPDVIVLRRSHYFKIVLFFDPSFKDNRYLYTYHQLEQNVEYNKIYWSQTFSIFMK